MVDRPRTPLLIRSYLRHPDLRFPVSGRTWTFNGTLYVPAQTIAQYDWPLPIVPRSVPPFIFPNIALVRTVEVVEEFVPPQYLYPLPPVAPFPVSGRSGYHNFVLYSPADLILTGFEYNWQMVKRLPWRPILHDFPNIALLAPITQAISQLDWPLPPVQSRVPQNFIFPNIALLGTVVVAEEFVPPQYLYPLPPLPVFPTLSRTWISQGIRPEVVELPLNQYDWPPAPRGAQYSVGLRGWLNPGIWQISGAQPFNQYFWPLPVPPFIPKSVRTWIDATRLNLVPPTPIIAQYDWPLPRRAEHPTAARTWLSRGIWQISGNQPFNQYEWPLPRVAVPPTSLRTWISQVRLPLVVTQPPVRQHDWPVPQRAPWPQALRTWIDQTKLALVSIRPPIAQHEWPLPRAPLYPVSARTWLQRAIWQISGNRPFNQYSWPLPKLKPYQQHESHITLQALGTFQPGDPVRPMREWPLPRPPLFKTSLRTWINPVIRMEGQKPFAQTSWPLPQRTVQPVSAQTWIQAAIRVVSPPIRQHDWPRPLRQLHAPLETYHANLALGVTAAIEVPLSITRRAWPLPHQAFFPVSSRTWIQAAIREVVAEAPRNQYDWPVPRRRSGVFLESYHVNLALGVPVAVDVPISLINHDWPRPILPHYPDAGRFWTSGWNLNILTVPSERPISQYDWPVPIASLYQNYYRPMSSRTIAHNLAHITPPGPEPPEPPEPSYYPSGYESQVGVWHVHGRGGGEGRTGKRYRIYPAPGS